MVSFVYNIAKGGFADATFDWSAGVMSFVITLVSSYAADPDDTAASFFSGDELDGSNYDSGFGNSMRLAIASPTVTVQDADDQAELDMANVTWTAIDGGQACAAVILFESGDDNLSPLVAYIDDGFGIVTNGGNFTISFAGSGVIKLASNA